MQPFTSLRRLWLGQLPLPEAFWRYSIIYDLVLNLVGTLIALALFVNAAPIALAVMFHLLPLPYSLYALTGTWRSADRYEGERFYANAAKVALVIWLGFWLIF